MMAQELVTAVQEGIKLVVVLVQNHGFASIGALSESVGSQRFGTALPLPLRAGGEGGRLDGDVLPVDLAANAASLGADVIRVSGIAELRTALAQARASRRTTVVHVETDPLVPGAGQRVVVGRAGRRGLAPGQHHRRARPLRRPRRLNSTPTWTRRGEGQGRWARPVGPDT